MCSRTVMEVSEERKEASILEETERMHSGP